MHGIAAYRQIATLQEYVLIDVEARRVEVFRRQPGNEWLLHDYAGEATCGFDSVQLTLPMDTVFEDAEDTALAETEKGPGSNQMTPPRGGSLATQAERSQ